MTAEWVGRDEDLRFLARHLGHLEPGGCVLLKAKQRFNDISGMWQIWRGAAHREITEASKQVLSVA